MLMPVSIAFSLYALHQYIRRVVAHSFLFLPSFLLRIPLPSPKRSLRKSHTLTKNVRALGQAMLRRRDPGPWDDRVGPTVLGILLLVTRPNPPFSSRFNSRGIETCA